MSTHTYSSLLSDMWAPEGSELSHRLQKLQQLEKLRKEREAQRQTSQVGQSGSTSVRSRLRSNPTDSEMNPASFWVDKFKTQVTDTYGGARPKFSSSSEEQPGQDWDQMFQTVTGKILHKRDPEQNISNFGRSRYGRSETDDTSTDFRSKYSSSVRSYAQPNSIHYNRSISQPEDQGNNIFSVVRASVLDRTEDWPSYTLNSGDPNNYNWRGYENTNEEMTTGELEQEHIENGQTQDEEVIEIVDEEEYEEPMHFIERLKSGSNSEEYNSEFGVNQKRNVNDGLLAANIPTLPPLKKLKPGENEMSNDDEQFDDVTECIHPVEDIIAVAKDINAAFGSRSPGKSEAEYGQESSPSGINFTFHTNSTAQNDLSPNDNFVFTASTPDNSSAAKLARNSGTKRKQRSDLQGKTDKNESFKSHSVTSSEEVEHLNNDLDTVDTSYVYEVIELPEDSFTAEQEELASVAKDLYKSRLSEYIDSDQTTGKLDKMQEFFSGKEVRGDPKIWRVLSGSMVESDLEKIITDSPPKGTKEDKEVGLSLGDKLTRLKSMTDEKSKKYSIEIEEEPSNKHNNSVSSNKEDLCEQSESENKRRSQSSELEAKKSPRDLVNDVRELKNFIHKNVSEPPTPTFETQISVDKRSVKEISTQTDFHDTVYICKHCGKSSSENVEKGKKSDGKSYKLDLRVETKNPGQNYALLEKKHLAEINKEIKASSKAAAETDNKKPINGGKTKTAGPSRSYMKSTASSSKKTTGPVDKTRKGSVPEINKVKENETQRTKSPVGFLRGGKNIVAQRAKAFDNANSKTNGSQKTKTGLSVYRGTSADRQKNEDVGSKGTKTAAKILKSKSLEQMHVFPDDKSVKDTEDSSKDFRKEKSVDDKSSRKLSKQKSVGDEIDSSNESAQTFQLESRKLDLPIKTAQIVGVEEIDKSEDSNILPSPGSKRTRAQMTQKILPPAISPKPVRKIESPIITSPTPRSPLHSAKTSAYERPPSENEDHKYELTNSPKLTHISAASHANAETEQRKKVESSGQFTTLQDNPFIKNDAKKRNSIRGRKDGESVWEREQSRSRESSLRRSNTSVGERSSLTHLSWSDSGSTESLPASVSSSRGSNSNLQRTRSERLGSVSSITSQNSMLNLLDSKGTKTNVVTGMKETNVDEAYEEYIASKDNAEKEDGQTDPLNESALIDFAQKTCDLLEFEPKKRDSSSDSTENDGHSKVDSSNTQRAVTENGTSHLKNGVVDNSNAPTEKAGKKGKSKKGFFKGKLFNK